MQNNITPILNELAIHCLETAEIPKQYSTLDLENAAIIMMDVLMNKSFELMRKENIDLSTGSAMAEKCGAEFRQLIKTYTSIDMHDICKQK